MLKQLGFKKLLAFIVISASVAVIYQIPFLRYTFYEQMKSALSLTDTQMGDTQAALTALNLVGYPIGGWLAARFSPKKLLSATLAIYAVVTAMFFVTTNYIVLLVIFAVYGFFGTATTWSAYLLALRTLVDEKHQSTIFGSSEATRGIIQTINAFIFLAIMARSATAVSGYMNVMLYGVILYIVLLILAVIFLPSSSADEYAGKEDQGGNRYTFWQVVKEPGVWICIIVIMCAYVVWTVGNNYLTTYTVRVLNMSETMASTVGIIRSYIVVFLAGFLGGWFLDKFSLKGKGFVIFFCVTIVCLIGAMTTDKILVICLLFTLAISFMANCMKSTYFSIMGQAGIPRSMTAMATGVISLIAFIPDFITPTLCGRWLDAATAAGDVTMGFKKIFIMMIGFAVVGVIGAILLARSGKKVLEAGEAQTDGKKAD